MTSTAETAEQFLGEPSGTIFYASGEKGLNVRADGRGGSLDRGWYVRTTGYGSHLVGPFATKGAAKRRPESGNNPCLVAVVRHSTPASFDT